MPKITTRPTRRSKAEIEKEFSQIAQEVETQKKGASPKADEAARASEEEIRQAIEGASGAQALSHVNKIAMEQAKTRLPQG